jgi:hypothetical protein
MLSRVVRACTRGLVSVRQELKQSSVQVMNDPGHKKDEGAQGYVLKYTLSVWVVGCLSTE